MHEYCDHLPDHGTTGWHIACGVIFSALVIAGCLTAGMYTAMEIMDLRARVEALEEAVAAPIELELIIPGQFEVEPTPAPRKGRDC